MYLLDSDAARKLCQYELIRELALALGCDLAGFAVLPQLRFQLKLNSRAAALKKLGSEAAVALAEDLICHAKVVEVLVEQSNYFLGVDRPDIDSGEAVLFAALYQRPEDGMVSGDKKAFIALSRFCDAEVSSALWVRLICLEEALMLILEHENFVEVSAKIRARSDVDKALSMAFGRSQASEKSSVIEALGSYVHDLCSETDRRWVALDGKSPHLSLTSCRSGG